MDDVHAGLHLMKEIVVALTTEHEGVTIKWEEAQNGKDYRLLLSQHRMTIIFEIAADTLANPRSPQFRDATDSIKRNLAELFKRAAPDR